MIKDLSLTILQKAINHALQLDAAMPSRLQALDGRVLELIISPLQVHFFLCFTPTELQLKAHHPGEADAVIHSSPLGLIRLSLLPASKVRSLFNDSVKITGDIELGQRVKLLFDELDIDWEGHLARFTGDVVAYQVGSLVRKGRSLTHRVSKSMQHNIRDYLQEELRACPPKEELTDFFNDVDTLSLTVERLAAHVNALS